MMQSQLSNQYYSKYSLAARYKGTPSKWNEFDKDLIQYMQVNKLSDLTNFQDINYQIGIAIAKEPKQADKNNLYAVQKYAGEKQNENTMKREMGDKHMQAYALLKEWLDPNFLLSMDSDFNTELLTVYNKHSIIYLKEFRALYTVLKKKCTPDPGVAVEKSKQKFASLPINSSFKDIVEAIKIHEYELSFIQKQDSDGKDMRDTQGKLMYHTMDEVFMYQTLLKLLSDKNDTNKQIVYQIYHNTTDTPNFKGLYKVIKSTVEKDLLNGQQEIHSNNNQSTTIRDHTTLTTTSVNANYSEHRSTNYNNGNQRDNSRFNKSKEMFCLNCKKTTHYTYNCPDSDCHSCKKSFSSVEHRQEHARLEHGKNRRTYNYNEGRYGTFCEPTSTKDNYRRNGDERGRDFRTRHSQSKERDNRNNYDNRGRQDRYADINRDRSRSRERDNGDNRNNDRRKYNSNSQDRSKSPGRRIGNNNNNDSRNNRVQFNGNKSYGNGAVMYEEDDEYSEE
jgi:hypothetical protein